MVGKAWLLNANLIFRDITRWKQSNLHHLQEGRPEAPADPNLTGRVLLQKRRGQTLVSIA